jgi:hypothetical protein
MKINTTIAKTEGTAQKAEGREVSDLAPLTA